MSAQLRVLLFVVLTLAAVFGQAEGRQRKGFVLGCGFGLGGTRVSHDGSLGELSIWKGAPAVDARIGYAPSNRTAIFFGFKSVLTYGSMIADKYEAYFDTMGEKNFRAVLAIMGAPFALPFLWVPGSHSTLGLVGVDYYFQETTPSFYLEGTMGVGIVPDGFREAAVGGFGFSAGVGYEFTRGTSVRLDLMYASGSESTTSDYWYRVKEKASAFSLLGTVNWRLF